MERGHQVGLGSNDPNQCQILFPGSTATCLRCLKTDIPKTKTTIEAFVDFVNVMFTNVNQTPLSTVDTFVNKVNAAFTNVNNTALNVRGDVSKTSQVRSTYCAVHQSTMSESHIDKERFSLWALDTNHRSHRVSLRFWRERFAKAPLLKLSVRMECARAQEFRLNSGMCV